MGTICYVISSVISICSDVNLYFESKISSGFATSIADLPAEQLEKIIQRKKAKGETTKGLYRTLLRVYLKANNVQKTEELIEEMESSDFLLTTGSYAQLIDLYCSNNALDKALAIHAKIKSKEPEFVLDDVKTMKGKV